ncbi:hypothetical protein LUZ62_065846 [Rhynchospora pubera]|uniref:cysteine dioxygenase n=1 Tax=Rhynchospora pubera TaxID=906938 RepID=A0AAV8ELJ5_9POAL|nr:hypothetical protein LUZ62_065846 [Rhynchospora pubera]
MKVEGSTGGEEGATRKVQKRELRNGESHNGVKLRGKRRTRRRVQADSSVGIQRLFMACKKVFKGPGTVPEPAEVDMLQQLLDKMRPEDVGLSTDLVFFKSKSASKGTPRITYTTIYKCNNFSMVMFFLPPRAVIPLHNHPGMTVFSKLLLGSMHIKSYDWIEPTSNGLTQPDPLRLAKKVEDSDFTAPCDTSILYPTTGGNMHTFTAITACAVLDVLGPPYSIEEDRDCTYYQDFPYLHHVPHGETDLTAEQRDKLGWLQEIEMPKDLKMDGIEYLGPPIIDT